MKHWQAARAAAAGPSAGEGEERLRPASLAAETVVNQKAGPIERGENWDETLQAASRLRLVLGAARRIAAVTGIDASDGATVLAARLAFAMAELDQGPILLVDGNGGTPDLDSLFGVNRSPGLLEALEGRAGFEQALRRSGREPLFVLPFGASEHSLASLLTAESAAGLLRAAREQFRYILIDAGLIRKSAAAILLAAMSDGVVVALARGIRRRDEVAAFHQELDNLKIPALGAVLTRMGGKRAAR